MEPEWNWNRTGMEPAWNRNDFENNGYRTKEWVNMFVILQFRSSRIPSDLNLAKSNLCVTLVIEDKTIV